MVAQGRLESAMALRAHLAIGKPPTSDLLHHDVITRAIDVRDCAAFLDLLACRVQMVNVVAAVESLTKMIDKSDGTDVLQVANLVEKSLKRISRGKPTPPTVGALIQLAGKLLLKANESSPKGKKKQSPYVGIIGFLLPMARSSDSDKIKWEMLQVALLANDRVGADVEHSLDAETASGVDFIELVESVLAAITRPAATQDVTSFSKKARQLLRHRLTETRARKALLQLWDERVKLSEAVQQTLGEILGQPSSAPASDLEVPSAASLQTLQLASALLAAWEARDTSTKAESAFQQLQITFRDFCSLSLRGEPGEVADFNPRLHEVEGQTGLFERVRIIRPRVEFAEPNGIALVLIKSLAAPAGDNK